MKELGLAELAGKGISRRPVSSIAMVICFALITGAMLSSLLLIGSTECIIDEGRDRLGADLVVVPIDHQVMIEERTYTGKGSREAEANVGYDEQLAILMVDPTGLYFNDTELAQARQIPGVRTASPQAYVNMTSAPFDHIVGFDPVTDFVIQPWVSGGLSGVMEMGEAICGSSVLVASGEELLINGQRFEVIGRLDPTNTGLDVAVCICLDDLYALGSDDGGPTPLPIHPGQISAIMVMGETGTELGILAENIINNVPNTYVIRSSALRVGVVEQLNSVASSLRLATLIMIAVLTPQIALVTSLVSNTRRREFGLLRAFGGNKAFIFKLMFTETLLLATIGVLLGTGVTVLGLLAVAQGAVPQLIPAFVWPPLGSVTLYVMTTLMVVMSVGVLSALYPADESIWQDPFESIRKGGER